jgi:hypothetical protein
MKKNHKILFIAIAIIAILSIGVWFSEASINYGFNLDYRYQKENGNWVTVNTMTGNKTSGLLVSVDCNNVGAMAGSFDIVVEFSGANISSQTPLPYTLMNNSTAKFPLSLSGGGNQAVDVYFTIDNATTNFDVTVNCQDGQLLMHSTESNWGGQNTLSYSINDAKDAFNPPPLPA